MHKCGAVAQLGERRVRNAKVEGSIPFRSTIFFSGHHHDFPYLGVRLQVPVRLDYLIETKRARDDRLQVSVRQPAQDECLRARETLGDVARSLAARLA